MPTASPLFSFALGVLSILILVSAVWVVSLRNLFRAALSLGLVLLGVAGLFLLLEAEFLAFAQILVYVGAVLTLVVFAIMLTAGLQAAPEHSLPAAHRLIAGSFCGGLFIVLAWATQAVGWPEAPTGLPVELASIGQQLTTSLLLPLQVIALVFAASVVGAVAIALTPSGRSSAEDRE